MITERPWGQFEVLAGGESPSVPGRWQIKVLRINPGQSISLQYHLHRSEDWHFVQGIGMVEVGGIRHAVMAPRARLHVPAMVAHRIHNTGMEDLVVVEVQVGDPISEEDIVRLDDMYGRGKVI